MNVNWRGAAHCFIHPSSCTWGVELKLEVLGVASWHHSFAGSSWGDPYGIYGQFDEENHGKLWWTSRQTWQHPNFGDQNWSSKWVPMSSGWTEADKLWRDLRLKYEALSWKLVSPIPIASGVRSWDFRLYKQHANWRLGGVWNIIVLYDDPALGLLGGWKVSVHSWLDMFRVYMWGMVNV